MTNWDYTRDESRPDIKTGVQRCVIVGAEESVSKKTGNPMIVVTVKPSGSTAKVKTYLVHNEFFNRNCTQFFDAFPEIEDGNFDLLSWVGALGAANFGTDENGYLKVKWFVAPDKAKDLPDFVGDKPEKQTVTSLDDDGEVEDELPFIMD